MFSVCEKKIPTLLFTRCQALQCHDLLNGLTHRGSTHAKQISGFLFKGKTPHY